MWKKVKWETTKYGWENKNKELVGKERIVRFIMSFHKEKFLILLQKRPKKKYIKKVCISNEMILIHYLFSYNVC